MQKRLILLSIILLSGFLSFSQNVSITAGEPYEYLDAQSISYLSDGTDILAVKIVKKEYYLQKLSANDLTLKKFTLYNDIPKDAVMELITRIQDKYYLFYSRHNDDVEELFAREIDFKNCSFIDKGKLILSVKERLAGGGFIFGVAKYVFKFSHDQSVLSIKYTLKPKIRDNSQNHEIIGMNVFDKNLTMIWQKQIEMPYTEKKMDNIDFSIDSKGNGYTVARVYNNESTRDKEKETDKINYHIEILKIMAQTGKVVPVKVDLKGNFLFDLRLYESPKNFMICTGYYNTGEDYVASDGIISFKIDDENKIYDFKTYEFSLELLNQYTTKKQTKRNNNNNEEGSAELANLFLKKIIPEQDGSLVIIGEQKEMSVARTGSIGSSDRSTIVTYYYNNIIMSKINPSGDIAWIKKLPKRQQGEGGTAGLSFCHFQNDTDHCLFFFDNEENMTLTENDYPSQYKVSSGGSLTMYNVNDQSGAVKKVSILNTLDVKGIKLFRLDPDRIQKTSPNTFILESYKKKKEDILIKVEIK